MFVNSEKELEDYICKNIEQFKTFLKQIYKYNKNIDQINFIGRQINLNGYYADLLFDSVVEEIIDEEQDLKYKTRTFIVIELKFRNLKPNDLSQLCKYLNLLERYNSDDDCEINTKGILLGIDLDNETQEIQMYFDYITDDRIKFCDIKTNLSFQESNYNYTEEYASNLKYDRRLEIND